jgi:serine/threonine-protein kinase RsbT
MQVVAILARYMSAANANSIVGNAVRQGSLDQDKLSARDLPVTIARLERGIRLFVAPDRIPTLWQELDALAGLSAEPPVTIVVIQSEADISRARQIVKEMCERYRLNSFATQKAATRVSELARNIVSYTQGASIEISRGEGEDINITVRGGTPGIANIDEVLSGRYRTLANQTPPASSRKRDDKSN